jgi:hypothetical protein
LLLLLLLLLLLWPLLLLPAVLLRLQGPLRMQLLLCLPLRVLGPLASTGWE